MTPDAALSSSAMQRALDPASTSTLRAMVLCAVGAIVGLSIAGYGLFTAAGTSTRTVPPESVAMVNQRPILRSDFIAQTESELGKTFAEATRDERLKVLDEMVREELLVQRSLELDFAETDQDSRNALVTAVTQQITVGIVTSEPDEQQLMNFYETHKEQFSSEGRMQVVDLVLAGENMEVGRAAANALRSGTSVEDVMAGFGLTQPVRHDEDYYFAVKYRLGDVLFAQVEHLSAGAVNEPVRLGDAIHIVQVVSNTRPVPLAYPIARAQVATDFKMFEHERSLNATLTFLRGRSTILIADDYAADYKP
ncbi:hypothetical protein HNQ60_005418 [Povalibacter uvarum]|uniref:peptidylprolyl isomerase n=1 Tax=Povalibacter uvarum TaxID=732238 RepID=A0A841HUA9_9GAMM|nr:peptidylprolyl isomerase [Povalibacter uvarum]MBB6096496.1 hypothetical protein [Povalibacter uvarum]